MAEQWRPLCSVEELDIDTTLMCGQTFRWVRLATAVDNGANPLWRGVVGRSVVSLRAEGGSVSWKLDASHGVSNVNDARVLDATEAAVRDYFRLSDAFSLPCIALGRQSHSMALQTLVVMVQLMSLQRSRASAMQHWSVASAHVPATKTATSMLRQRQPTHQLPSAPNQQNHDRAEYPVPQHKQQLLHRPPRRRPLQRASYQGKFACANDSVRSLAPCVAFDFYASRQSSVPSRSSAHKTTMWLEFNNSCAHWPSKPAPRLRPSRYRPNLSLNRAPKCSA